LVQRVKPFDIKHKLLIAFMDLALLNLVPYLKGSLGSADLVPNIEGSEKAA